MTLTLAFSLLFMFGVAHIVLSDRFLVLCGEFDGEFGNVRSLLDGIIPKWSHRISAGSVAMFGVAVCSVQFSVLPLLPGHNVEIHNGIEGVLMFGDENFALLTSRPATDISSVYAP